MFERKVVSVSSAVVAWVRMLLNTWEISCWKWVHANVVGPCSGLLQGFTTKVLSLK